MFEKRLSVWCAAIALMTAVPPAFAEEAVPRICAGAIGGAYHHAAVQAKAALADEGLGLVVLETEGSIDNLKRLASGGCEAALTQGDALFLGRRDPALRELEMTIPLRLYSELVHLVCRRAAGVEDLKDLMRHPERHTVLIGAPNSGSVFTWRTFSELDERMAELPNEMVGGEAALARLLQGKNADCLLQVSRPETLFLASVDQVGADLRLVPLDLWYFNEAEDLNAALYTSTRIPDGTYDKLQDDLREPDVETIAVGAFLVVQRDWAKANPKAHRALLKAMKAAATLGR